MVPEWSLLETENGWKTKRQEECDYWISQRVYCVGKHSIKGVHWCFFGYWYCLGWMCGDGATFTLNNWWNNETVQLFSVVTVSGHGDSFWLPRIDPWWESVFIAHSSLGHLEPDLPKGVWSVTLSSFLHRSNYLLIYNYSGYTAPGLDGTILSLFRCPFPVFLFAVIISNGHDNSEKRKIYTHYIKLLDRLVVLQDEAPITCPAPCIISSTLTLLNLGCWGI